MIRILQGCCGVAELQNISDYESQQEVVRLIGLSSNRFAQLVFVQASNPRQEKPEKPLRKDFGRQDVEEYNDAILEYEEELESYESETRPYGQELMDHILAKRLGSVIRSAPQVNPGTGNILITFVWTPDWKKLKGR